MENETSLKKNKNNLFNYGKAMCFVLLEILAIISFSLGSSFIFFAILSFVALALVILVTFKEIKSDGLSSFAFFLFPILLFAVLSILSYFAKYDPYFVMNKSPMLFLVPVGLVCFASIGYFVNLTGAFKIKYALIVIYSGIALLTFINLVVTMIQFTPFYTLRYPDSYFYYDGAPSSEPVGRMGYFLMGFSMVEVSLSYFSFYPIILLTAFLPLIHVKYRENRKLFVTYLSFGLLGLLTLILTINKMTLILLFIVSLVIGVIALYDKFNVTTKPLKIIGIVIGILFSLGLLFLILNAQDSVGYDIRERIPGIRNFTTGNSFLNRLFNTNRYVTPINSILDGLFHAQVIEGSNILVKFLGFPINGSYLSYFGTMTWKLTDSNSFFFDSFFTSGFIGVIFLTAILIVGLRRLFIYYKNSDDGKEEKVTVLGFVLVNLIYAFVAFDATPTIFSKTVIPFYLNNIFLLDLFLFGYVFFKTEKKKKKYVVVKEVEETVNEEAQ